MNGLREIHQRMIKDRKPGDRQRQMQNFIEKSRNTSSLVSEKEEKKDLRQTDKHSQGDYRRVSHRDQGRIRQTRNRNGFYRDRRESEVNKGKHSIEIEGWRYWLLFEGRSGGHQQRFGDIKG